MMYELNYGAGMLAARDLIREHLLPTEIRELRWLSEVAGVPVFAKLEFHQPTGSFKVRGALNALSAVDPNVVSIVASAGNHALASAYAAKLLGRKLKICLPSIASQLKRAKLSSYGVQLMFHGESLEQALSHSSEVAKSRGWHFISPFDHAAVIAGAATLLLEAQEQLPEIGTLVVPTGGGGLLAGCVLADRFVNSNVRLIAATPAALKTDRFGTISGGPTLADGLAVKAPASALTSQIISSGETELCLLSEDELAAGTLAFLNQESWLVEPSGAAGVAVILRLARQGRLRGPVLLPLTGGNLSKSVLARLFSTHIDDIELAELAGVRALRPQSVKVLTGITYDHAENIDPACQDFRSRARKRLVADISARLATFQQQLLEFESYASKSGLAYPRAALAIASKMVAHIDEELAGAAHSDCGSNHQAELQSLRAISSTIALFSVAFDWRSPAYAQSKASEFFRLSSQHSPLANYDRYGHPSVREVEEQLREVLGASASDADCLATSSGMAAFSVIEAWLLRNNSAKSLKIGIAPYIYFEAAEQLQTLPNVRVERFASYDADEIVKRIVDEHFDAVFVDPVANSVEMRGIDIIRFLDTLRESAQRPVTVVIDGTMVSGALPPVLFGSDSNDSRLSVLYYESASKYLQLGLEHCLAGVIVHRSALRSSLEKLRRNIGAILYPSSALGFPRYTRSFYVEHMRGISDCATKIAVSLAEDEVVSKYLKVIYPGLPSHPDYQFLKDLDNLGGCMTFIFNDRGRHTSDFLNGFIELLLEYAQLFDLSIVKGVSFGFNNIRISAASSIDESDWPFLRLYSSVVSDREIQSLVKAFSLACDNSVI